MKRMQDVEIKGMHFRVEELTTRESANMIDAYNHIYKHVDIYDVYKNPSDAKVSVWNEWVNWARDVNIFDIFCYPYEVRNLSICSHNDQTFTVCAIIREFDTEDEMYRKLCGNYLTVATYIMVATRYHNYLYLLTSDESGDDIDVCW